MGHKYNVIMNKMPVSQTCRYNAPHPGPCRRPVRKEFNTRPTKYYGTWLSKDPIKRIDLMGPGV